MNYKKIKNLKQAVHDILRDTPATRNSDVLLTIEVWRKFFPKVIKMGQSEKEGIWLEDLYWLPREDNVKRVRAHWQNDMGMFLPTEWVIAKARKIAEDEWRVAMGYPTKDTTGTRQPSFIPPSEVV